MGSEPRTLRQIISYLFWGTCTTGVNILSFTLLRRFTALPLAGANSLAWFFSVIFAFITNKHFVFLNTRQSTEKSVRQFCFFILSRLFSGIVDIALMELLVSTIGLPELHSKILVNMVVIALNYIVSKFLIFSGAPND